MRQILGDLAGEDLATGGPWAADFANGVLDGAFEPLSSAELQSHLGSIQRLADVRQPPLI